MDGPAHYKEGERILDVVHKHLAEATPETGEWVAQASAVNVELAKAHFAAAQVAATMATIHHAYRANSAEWEEALS